MSHIDWSALAASEELDLRTEFTTDSGLIVPSFGGTRLASWVKFRGEPAQTFIETPAMFAARWLAFRDDPEQEVVVFHEWAYGQACFFFRAALEQLDYVQVTYPTGANLTKPGSVRSGDCPCWRYGGPCKAPQL